jgi:hypothetical protein
MTTQRFLQKLRIMLRHGIILMIILLLSAWICLSFEAGAEVVDGKEGALSDMAISEQRDYFAKFVTPHQINRKQIVRTNGVEDEIILLGAIEDKRGHALYYLLTDFRKVQAAITVHGHPWIIYLDANKKFVKQYDVGSPEELPFKLKKNALYFYYINTETKKKTVYVNNVGTSPPKLMCVGPVGLGGDCY